MIKSEKNSTLSYKYCYRLIGPVGRVLVQSQVASYQGL